MVNSILHFCCRFHSRETVSPFLYECSKFTSFYVLTNTIMETMDSEEAAIFSAQSALTSGSRKEELFQSHWTN